MPHRVYKTDIPFSQHGHNQVSCGMEEISMHVGSWWAHYTSG